MKPESIDKYLERTIIPEGDLLCMVRNEEFKDKNIILASFGGDPLWMKPESKYSYDLSSELIENGSTRCDILLFYDEFNQKNEEDIHDKLIEDNKHYEKIYFQKINVPLSYSTSTEAQRTMQEAYKKSSDVVIIPQCRSDLDQRSEVIALAMHANNPENIPCYVPRIGKGIDVGKNGIGKKIENKVYKRFYNCSDTDIAQKILSPMQAIKLLGYAYRRMTKPQRDYKNL